MITISINHYNEFFDWVEFEGGAAVLDHLLGEGNWKADQDDEQVENLAYFMESPCRYVIESVDDLVYEVAHLSIFDRSEAEAEREERNAIVRLNYMANGMRSFV